MGLKPSTYSLSTKPHAYSEKMREDLTENKNKANKSQDTPEYSLSGEVTWAQSLIKILVEYYAKRTQRQQIRNKI